MKKPNTPPSPPAPPPITVPAMPGAHNYAGERTLSSSPAAVLLAQVAAPFAAANMTDGVAIARAAALLSSCEEYLFHLDYADLVELYNEANPGIDLNKAVEILERSRDTVRAYMNKILGTEKAASAWKAALNGEAIFNRDLMMKLKAEREGAYKSRQKQAEKSGKI